MAYIPSVPTPTPFKVQSVGAELAATAVNFGPNFLTTLRGNVADVSLIDSLANSVVKNIYAVPIAGATSSAQIEYDNTTPAATEGSAVSNVPLTSVDINSKFIISYNVTVDASAMRSVILAAFRNTTYIGGTIVYISGAGRPQMASLNLLDVFPSTLPRTYSLRVGLNGTGTWYVNRQATPYFNGGLAKNIAMITEVI